MMRQRFTLIGILLLAMLAPKAWAQTQPLTVYAASSLTTVLGEWGVAYTQATGTPVKFSFASSATLARQIEAGAPADLFISADTDWMNYIAQRGLIRPETRRDLWSNRLALVAPAASKMTLKIAPNMPMAAKLGRRGRLAMADPDYVPAGRYGRAALISLGVWPSVERRLVRADNVRGALTFVARGETPLGIVYETDAREEPKVRLVGLFPLGSHPPIRYPAAITAHSRHAKSEDFLRSLSSPKARALFERAGFTAIEHR
jgi:molybdate transport system substrate-binding protein